MNNGELKEIETKQEEILTLTQKIWRAEKWRRFWATLKWVIYLGIALGAFYFINPYFEEVVRIYQEFRSVGNLQILK